MSESKVFLSGANDPAIEQAHEKARANFRYFWRELAWELHELALAGSSANVRILLEAGADPNVRTNDGVTPLQLAQSLRWENVIALLSRT